MRDDLHVVANELARAALRGAVRAAGLAFEADMDRRIARFADDQRRLRARYRITVDTPILTYGDEVRRAVEAFAARHRDARFAYTSGSTAEPKKIAFTRRRLRTIKAGSFSVAARLLRRHRVDRTGLFILSGLKEDDSLTALLLGDRGQTPWAAGLLMPARYLAQPAMAPVIERYGATAARLWLLALANPGILYSTNPSTLALFLTELHERWDASAALVREHDALDAGVRAIARRVAGAGWRERFARIAEARAPLPLRAIAPGVAVYCCWDGGYVRPFLGQVERFLPRDDYAFVPMYSMSTETVETLTYFGDDGVRFLPVAPGVLYEFLPDGAADEPAQLLAATELRTGRLYTMVVSDGYGLRRYQTEDLFEHAGAVGDVPDLRFVRRRGLAYSFTGEKLTDRHVLEACARVREAFPALAASGTQLTCVPSRPAGALVPRYVLVLAHPGRAPDVNAAAVAASFDRALGEVNRELAAKHASGRLGATVAVAMPYDRLAAALDPKSRAAGDDRARVWDTQFKLLPLYRVLWEDVAGDR